MKYNLYLLLLSIILSSCNNKIEKNVILNSHDLSRDTLFRPKNNLLEKKNVWIKLRVTKTDMELYSQILYRPTYSF
jgi:hypothetical protein